MHNHSTSCTILHHSSPRRTCLAAAAAAAAPFFPLTGEGDRRAMGSSGMLVALSFNVELASTTKIIDIYRILQYPPITVLALPFSPPPISLNSFFSYTFLVDGPIGPTFAPCSNQDNYIASNSEKVPLGFMLSRICSFLLRIENAAVVNYGSKCTSTRAFLSSSFEREAISAIVY